MHFIELDDAVVVSEASHDHDLVDKGLDVGLGQAMFGKWLNGELFSELVLDLVDVWEGALADGFDVLVLLMDSTEYTFVLQQVSPDPKIF